MKLVKNELHAMNTVRIHHQQTWRHQTEEACVASWWSTQHAVIPREVM